MTLTGSVNGSLGQVGQGDNACAPFALFCLLFDLFPWHSQVSTWPTFYNL